MGGMSEREEKRGGAGCIVLLALLMLAVPVLYVVGLGPMSWFVHTDRMSPDTWEMIYSPVLWVADRSDSLQNAVVWYIDLFRPA
jgi:hypothetical protein